MNLQLRELDLTIERSPLQRYIRHVERELDRRGLVFRPHFWLSEEWFCPDNIPGVAIPFYLAHPRLIRLERKQMLEVEGGTRESCLQILRHEVGHAIDHAYLLHRRRGWQQRFGKSSDPYPEYYKPKPFSKNYVQHLDYWYAQSHPDEDFAETFAVWLKPRAIWRKRYQEWPALRKLEYVDELMREIDGRPPRVTLRTKVEPVSQLKRTLREHYERKRAAYAVEYPRFYDHDLRRIFSDSPEDRHRESASTFLRRIRGEVRQMVARWTGEYQYTLDRVLREMIGRCAELKLRVAGREKELKTDFAIFLTVQTMNYLHGGRHRMSM